MDANEKGKTLLPHHQQMPLCMTRLPYRQGRKLTAVKVYTINDESNHLLVFGVPSLNLRQETKALFCKFGKLIHFAVSDKHASESFTETYHAVFERIQSARAAKRMLDTKNFYGGLLHVCYAPELESLEETRRKLMQRRKEVFIRLKKNHEEHVESSERIFLPETVVEKPKLVNMGESNIIMTAQNIRKRKANDERLLCKKIKSEEMPVLEVTTNADSLTDGRGSLSDNQSILDSDINRLAPVDTEPTIERDITTDSVVVTKCNKIELNYSDFGKEVIKKVPYKPLNRIKFYINKKYKCFFIVEQFVTKISSFSLPFFIYQT